MRKLIESTAAYATFSRDVSSDRLSHAYLLLFDDTKNMRGVLKLFALKFFGFEEGSKEGARLLNENLSDMRVYPEEGKKLNAAAAADLVSDSALRPVELQKKLYIVCGIDDAPPLVQNKLLKTLEEPPEYACYLLGAAATAPVLDTVLSRVKTLTIPPFSKEQIFEALERRCPNPLNSRIAASCGGILGVAEDMSGGKFEEISAAAAEICTADLKDIGEISIKYGNVSYKKELLAQMGYLYSEALKERVSGGSLGCVANKFSEHTLIYALESLVTANADLTYNAYFQGLLYDFMLRVIEENEKWSKLRE